MENYYGRNYNNNSIKNCHREFPGGPVVRTQCFHCCGLGSIPGRGTKIPQDVWHGQKIIVTELFIISMLDSDDFL